MSAGAWADRGEASATVISRPISMTCVGVLDMLAIIVDSLDGLYDETLPDRIEHDLGGVVEVQLLHQVRSMGLDCR